jgi:recombination protein RecT
MGEKTIMSTELITLERDLTRLTPQFSQVLGRTMSSDRLLRTVIISCERDPKLLAADRQSLYNSAMTGAVLGLEADGLTGQLFLLPFLERRNNRYVVQPVIGYKGYNTLGARAALSIGGDVVREGDEFDFADGSKPFVHHKKALGGEGRIIAAWSSASSHSRPPTIKVLSISEILAVKAKSPRGDKPPWADPGIGFAAMASKTAKRRLARDMPLNVFQLGAAMEEQHEELGRHSWIHPDRGVMIDGGEVIAPSHSSDTPTTEELLNPTPLQEEAKLAAERGVEVFRTFWKRIHAGDRAELRSGLPEWERIAKEADNEQP